MHPAVVGSQVGTHVVEARQVHEDKEQNIEGSKMKKQTKSFIAARPRYI